MENSIENIWKQGFLNNEALVAPRINQLYEKKSLSIINRLQTTLKWNVLGIYIFSALFLIYAIFSNTPLIPSIIFAVFFSGFGWYSAFRSKKMDAIDETMNSYDYLIAFKYWLKTEFNENVKIIRIFYPVSFIIAFSMVWYSDGRPKIVDKLLDAYPNHPMVGNMPLVFLLVLIVGVTLLFIFAKPLYKFDVRLIYGRTFDKLDEIISDLEELRK